MKYLFVIGAVTLFSSPVYAQDFEGSLGVTSQYIFRGITQSDGHSAVSGGLDVTSGTLHLGAWASTVDFNDGTSMELDFYAGYTMELAGFSLDVGGIYYAYPDAPSDPVDQNFAELYVAAERSFDRLVWDAKASYSANFYGESGVAWYTETGLAYALTDRLSIDTRIASSSFEDASADYRDYQIGLSGPLYKSTGWDFRYHETSVGSSALVLSLSAAFGI